MAISTEDTILAMLKTYYKKDGLENLLFRNSPVLKDIEKERVVGKEQAYSTMFSRGGAVGGDFQKAKKAAANTARAAEFRVVPGQLFSVYQMTAKEVQASKDNAGAYMPIAGARMFAANESFRKTLGACLYGSGYGELCTTGYDTQINNGKAFDLELPAHAVMAIDIGSQLVIKDTVTASDVKVTLEVMEINGNKVNVKPSGTYGSPKVTDVLCLDGSMDKEGNPLLPVGLEGWIPTAGKRTGQDWTTLINKKFFNVNRKVATDRLAGAYIDGENDDKIYKTIEKLIQKVRRQGSLADLIIMNDEDFMALSAEIESTNTFFTQTASTGKKAATVGFDKLAASFSTNYIDLIVDDPYCAKGKVYAVDKAYLKLWSYTNADNVKDGVEGNAAGKADVMEAGNDGTESKPYGLIIDDYLNVKPGADSTDGPSTEVSVLFYGSFVITNPSVVGVATLKGYNPMKYNA